MTPEIIFFIVDFHMMPVCRWCAGFFRIFAMEAQIFIFGHRVSQTRTGFGLIVLGKLSVRLNIIVQNYGWIHSARQQIDPVSPWESGWKCNSQLWHDL